jgi:hypothetical protein
MEFAFLPELTKHTKKATICMRVMRKWNYDGNIANGLVLHVGLVLAIQRYNSFIIYADFAYFTGPNAEFESYKRKHAHT